MPQSQAAWGEARQIIAVGETYDFEVRLVERANLVLEFFQPVGGGRWALQPLLVRREEGTLSEE